MVVSPMGICPWKEAIRLTLYPDYDGGKVSLRWPLRTLTELVFGLR